jgi:protein-tyrosine kinase
MTRPLPGAVTQEAVKEGADGSSLASTNAPFNGESPRTGGQACRDGIVRFPVARDEADDTDDGRSERDARKAALQIGQILVHARRMSDVDVGRVLKFASQSRLRFGDAALRMGLVERRDIDFALARQFSLPYLKRGETVVSPAVVAAHEPNDPAVEPFRALRAQIAMALGQDTDGHVAFAVVGAARGDGRSYTAANLAVVFAQLGRSTLLIDANLRSPSQHRLFGVGRRTGLSTVLAHRSGLESLHSIPGLTSLTLLPAGPTPPNPLELLERPRFGELLAGFVHKFQVVILDTPAGSEGSDGVLVAQRAGAALVVARSGRTRFGDAQHFAMALERTRTRVLGLVFNEKS